MTPEDRQDIAVRLIAMQNTLRSVFEACEAQAALCNDAGAKRLAFATHMVRESLITYSKELNSFVLGVIHENPETDEEYDLDY